MPLSAPLAPFNGKDLTPTPPTGMGHNSTEYRSVEDIDEKQVSTWLKHCSTRIIAFAPFVEHATKTGPGRGGDLRHLGHGMPFARTLQQDRKSVV